LLKQSLHIRHAFSQFLAVFKLDKQYKPSFQEYWLMDFLEVLQSQFTDLFPALSFKISADEDLSWFFDEQLMKVAIHNLVINALKAGATDIQINAEEMDSWLNCPYFRQRAWDSR
jgi:signal transduction histidine kinase